ncbi:MAG: cadmium-translocating P-type ATPase [Clostridia bacterium]|nr:cadmium-translocating P-type ATPase [Clostridia bacterium]
MKKDKIFLIVGAVLFAVSLFIPEEAAVVRFIGFLLAFIFCGMKVIISAVKGITKGNIFNENTLMVVAAVGAFCIKEYPEAVFVVLFYRIGEMFEDYAVKKSRKSISEVMNICPDYANLLVDGKAEKVDPDEVEIGDNIIVGVGERVALDGVVVSGKSFLDTSALTGESVPREVKAGDEILSGCINKNAVLTVRVTKSFDDSTVSRILELVETASSRKSTSEKFITKFAKYYTPVVLVCALILAVVPPLVIDGATFTDFIYRSLSFLVVSCPCALVISVPLAFFGGIGGSAKKGILVKGGNYLEVLSKAENIVFDKTGTLTKGVFRVQEINAVDIPEEEFLRLTAYSESVSSHPVARAVRDAYGKDIDMNKITSAEEIAGFGVKAVVDGKIVLAGNSKLMESENITYKKSDGTAVIYVAVDKKFTGSIIISDEVRDDAKEGISAIRKSGIKSVSMLTGDVKNTAETIARELGIDRVFSELLPDDKVNELEKIMKNAKGKTVYVGDGINDAPVLALADAGIAMGALGSDAAVEAADIVIMTDEISKIGTAMKIAKKTMNIAKQNIAFSLLIKIGILILCSFNIVGMGVAVFGDVGVMVLAVLNSFRALKEEK